MTTDTTTHTGGDTETLRLCREAILHVLDAIASDPRKFWLMGHGTGSRAKLLAAYCALTGKSEEEAAESWLPNQERYEAYVAEKESNERRLAELAAEEEFPFFEEEHAALVPVSNGIARILDALGGTESLFRLGFTEMERGELLSHVRALG